MPASIFNLHVDHTPEAIEAAAGAFRDLIDLGHRPRRQLLPDLSPLGTERSGRARLPADARVPGAEAGRDPGEVFQSNWYRHYRAMFG